MLVNVDRLKAIIAENKLDAVIAMSLENVHYFTGIWSVALNMFPNDGQLYAIVTADQPTAPFVVSSTVEIDQVLDGFPGVRGTSRFGTFYREHPEGVMLESHEAWLKQESVDNPGEPGPFEALLKALNQLGLMDKRIGIDEAGFKRGFMEMLIEKAPQASIVPISAKLRWVRKVKTAEEIRRIRASAHVTEQAIRAATSIARAGVTEAEMAREFDRSIVSQGGIPKFTMIRFGRNGVAGQVMPGRTQLKRGDTIWFDVGSVYAGYWSDLARIYSLGEPSQRVKTLYKALWDGEEYAIAHTKAGMTGADVFKMTIEATRAAGHPNYRRHHVGHGIGAEVYEPPILTPTSTDLVEEGMVVNIETPYYEFGLGALHVEDPFVVRASGNEVLTTLGRQLHIID